MNLRHLSQNYKGSSEEVLNQYCHKFVCTILNAFLVSKCDNKNSNFWSFDKVGKLWFVVHCRPSCDYWFGDFWDSQSGFEKILRKIQFLTNFCLRVKSEKMLCFLFDLKADCHYFDIYILVSSLTGLNS